MTPQELTAALPTTAVAFRGYNVTNLGRSPELLAVPAYEQTMLRWLRRGSKVAAEMLRRPVDLVEMVRGRHETTLATYGESIALVMALEEAQLELLATTFGVACRQARVTFGYSLGEISALVASGILTFENALQIPLALADDCASLAAGVTLAVLFTRAATLPMEAVNQAIDRVNLAGQGLLGLTTVLAPSALLLMGQGDALDRFQAELASVVTEKFVLRRREDVFPPLHTCITWLKHIPNRASLQLLTLPCSGQRPQPPVLSMVTGLLSYTHVNYRSLMTRWVDHPQQVWQVVTSSLAMGVDTVLHVGPAPNLLPATFTRLKENIESQTRGSIGMRALAAVVRRPWLAAVLPTEASLLRAPLVRQVNLEDWLIEHAPA
jgi:[acyl-carrier-protein] S-malonyltransferase